MNESDANKRARITSILGSLSDIETQMMYLDDKIPVLERSVQSLYYEFSMILVKLSDDTEV